MPTVDYDAIARKFGGVPLDYDALAKKYGGERAESKPVHHSSDDVETLRASAERQAPKIGDAVADATTGVPGAKVEAVRDSKDSDRIADKAERQGVQPSQIGDVAAAKVTVPHQEAADQVLANLHEQMPVESKEGSVTGEPGNNAVRQTQAIVNTGAPASEPVKKAEVIIQTPEMAKATDATHSDYRKAQDLRAAGKDKEASDIEAKISDTHNKAEQDARERQTDGKAPIPLDLASIKSKLPELQAKLSTSVRAPQPPSESLKGQRVEVKDSQTGQWKPGEVHADVTRSGPTTRPDPETRGESSLRKLRGVYDDGTKFDNVDAQNVRPVSQKKNPDVGVDFDGTLATETHSEELGEPLPERIASVQKMLDEGKTVEIITRRVEGKPEEVKRVQDWLVKNGLPRLPVTDVKSADMLYDDHAHHAPSNANTPLTKSNNARKK